MFSKKGPLGPFFVIVETSAAVSDLEGECNDVLALIGQTVQGRVCVDVNITIFQTLFDETQSPLLMSRSRQPAWVVIPAVSIVLRGPPNHHGEA